MNHKFTLFLLLQFFVAFCFAQSGMYVASTGSVAINANTVLSVDGLVLEPSSNYTIPGNSRLIRNSSIINYASGNYIGRVFIFSIINNAFSGIIGINYNDSELKGIPEANLTLNIFSGTDWCAFSSSVLVVPYFGVMALD